LNSANTVSVGPPVLSIGLSDCQSKEKKNQFIRLCKSHIKAEKLNLKLRESGIICALNWKKNEEVTMNELIPFKFNGEQNSAAMRKIYEHCNPYITALAGHSLENWNSDVITKVINDLQEVKNVIEGMNTSQDMEYTKKTIEVDVFPLGKTLTEYNSKEFYTGKKSTNDN
jgi:hypothetical protein